MFSENNSTTNLPRDLADCFILLIDLTLGEHLQILGERREGTQKWHLRYKTSGIPDTNQPRKKLLKTVLSVETRVQTIDWWQTWRPMVNFDLLFQGLKNFWHCQSTTKFGNVGGLPNQDSFPKFRELWSGVPWYHAATCISPSLIHL